jgi:hypothetical protein
MTTSFSPCATCSRHVKSADAACPFCGAAHAPARAKRIPRASRAVWLASSMALVGCTTTHSGGTNPFLAQSDAGLQLAEVFPCGDDTCVAGLEYCSVSPGNCGGSYSSCIKAPTDCVSSCAGWAACQADAGDPSTPTCTDVAAGAISVDYTQEGDYGGCQGCYGCPPARLERLVA